MPSLKQLKEYKTTCDDSLKALVEKANHKIVKAEENEGKVPDTIKELESPTLLELPTYPIYLDAKTPDTYDLFEVISFDELNKGNIQLIKTKHPQSGEPIDQDDLIIYGKKSLQKYINKLTAFVIEEIQSERIDEVITTLEASFNEILAADLPEPVEQPIPAHAEQPLHPIAAAEVKNPDDALSELLKITMLMIDNYNGQHDDAFLPKILPLCNLMQSLLINQNSASKLKDIISKEPQYPLDDAVKVFMFFFNHQEKYQQTKLQKDVVQDFKNGLPVHTKALLESLTQWLSDKKITKEPIHFYPMKEVAQPPAANPNPVVVQRQSQPNPNPAPHPIPQLHAFNEKPAAPEKSKAAPARMPEEANDNPEKTESYKLVLLGEKNSGKTHLVTRYVEGSFRRPKIMGLPIDFRLKVISLPDQANKNAKLQLWESFGSQTWNVRMISKNADAIIFTFDLADESSFKNITRWLDEIKKYELDDTTKLLVGCKSDLPHAIDPDTIKAFAEANKMAYIETSALMDINVEKLFSDLVKQLYYKEHPEAEVIGDPAKKALAMIKGLEHEKQSISDFNIAAFNALTKAANLNQEAREKMREALVNTLHEKVTQLDKKHNATSAYLEKVTDAMLALQNICDNLALIQPGFMSSQLNKKTTTMKTIDHMRGSLGISVGASVFHLPVSMFNLTLMMFKLTRYTCLEKLVPRPDNLLDNLIPAAIKGIDGITKDKDPHSPIKFCDTDQLIKDEVALLLKMKLNRTQLAAANDLNRIAEKCITYRESLDPAETVATAQSNARLGGNARLQNGLRP